MYLFVLVYFLFVVSKAVREFKSKYLNVFIKNCIRWLLIGPFPFKKNIFVIIIIIIVNKKLIWGQLYDSDLF